jgi:hypothetical protein
MHLLETEKFEDTFGKKAQRKRPRLAAGDMDELMKKVEESAGMLCAVCPALVDAHSRLYVAYSARPESC